MRRFLMLGLAGALLFGAMTSSYAGAAKRTETVEYLVPNGIHLGVASVHTSVDNWNTFKVRPGEKRLSISIEDDSGLPSAAQLYLPNQSSGMTVCGQTSKPLRVRPGDEISVGPSSAICEGSPSAAVAGTITLTFSK